MKIKVRTMFRPSRWFGIMATDQAEGELDGGNEEGEDQRPPQHRQVIFGCLPQEQELPIFPAQPS
ncbi:MAG: hypothetical protein KIS63_02700 [Caldilineales bacterium]|nr:hypothetical protein [Caldilineales bacterium]